MEKLAACYFSIGLTRGFFEYKRILKEDTKKANYDPVKLAFAKRRALFEGFIFNSILWPLSLGTSE